MVSRRAFGAASLGGLISGSLRAASGRPKLLVLIVAGQFRADYIDRNQRSFVTGGFRRLMEEGAYFPDCRFHSTTFTHTGLATLITGAYPQTHGIVGSRWYDRASSAITTAADGELLATTLADSFSAMRGNRVVSLAMDRSHAALLGGRAPHLVLVPGSDLSRFHDAPWTALGAKPGSPPLRTLTYDAARPAEFAALFNASPYAQSAQFETLREVMVKEQLGQGTQADMVAVTLGSLELLGHETGADSPLMRQLVLHLDRELEALLNQLTRDHGSGNFSVVFTAAHGAPPAPSEQERPRRAIQGEAVARAINRALTDRFGSSGGESWVERYVYPFLYLRPGALPIREMRRLAGEAALKLDGVAGFYTADRDCSHAGEWLRRFQNSFHLGRCGDVMLAYRPEYIEETGQQRGIAYGSLYNYDASVPLMLYGPRFEPGVHGHEVEAVDVAPTLARALGVSLPSSSSGRVLGEAFTGARYDA